MLTFERVLAAFKDYLEEDDRYTILMTPRGYTILVYGPGVAVREFAVNCGYMGADFLRNHRRRSAPIVESLNFRPLARPEIAEFPAHVPGLLP